MMAGSVLHRPNLAAAPPLLDHELPRSSSKPVQLSAMFSFELVPRAFRCV